MGCVPLAAALQMIVLGRKQRRRRRAGGAIVPGESELRQHGGDGDADLRARLVQLRLGGAHVGALLDELRGQAERQIASAAAAKPA